MTFADKVRLAMQRKKSISQPAELDIYGGDVWAALNYMRLTGEVIKVASNYIYVGRNRELVSDVVWRAWRYHPRWTINEIAGNLTLERSTVKKLVHKYRAYLIVVGKKGRLAIYKLKDKDLLERPKTVVPRFIGEKKGEGR